MDQQQIREIAGVVFNAFFGDVGSATSSAPWTMAVHYTNRSVKV